MILVPLELGARCSSNAPMRIPHSSSAWRCRFDVPFHHDCPGRGSFSFEYQLGDLYRSSITWIPNLEQWSWIVLVPKIWTRGHYHWKELAGYLQVDGDLDGVADDICTMIEICNLTCLGGSIQEALDSRGIILATNQRCLDLGKRVLPVTPFPVAYVFARRKPLAGNCSYCGFDRAKYAPLLVTRLVGRGIGANCC